MLNVVKNIIKSFSLGVSWQNSMVNTLFEIDDTLYFLVRKFKKLPDMPGYSIRVQSNGVTGQFGGEQFIRTIKRRLG